MSIADRITVGLNARENMIKRKYELIPLRGWVMIAEFYPKELARILKRVVKKPPELPKIRCEDCRTVVGRMEQIGKNKYLCEDCHYEWYYRD